MCPASEERERGRQRVCEGFVWTVPPSLKPIGGFGLVPHTAQAPPVPPISRQKWTIHHDLRKVQSTRMSTLRVDIFRDLTISKSG